MAMINLGVIRHVIARLKQPEMKAQRRFVIGAGLVLLLFVIWSFVQLAGQATEQELENAAIGIFAAMGVLIVVVMIGAVMVRRKTGDRIQESE